MSDEERAFLAPLLKPAAGRGFRPAGHRRALGAIFAVSRNGADWRELPGEAGKWNPVYRQFQR
jgi:transposase